MMNLKSHAPAKRLRTDIQGLRAIAVLAVVIYHIWPNFLPGGYTGVDVFFVISGYLITLNLLEEAEGKGNIDLIGFYIKRALRLIPASALVIFISLLVMPLHTVPYQLANGISQAFASLFYFQNWLLFSEAVDYLAADNQPTAFQHFWSLAIEEQFYLLWPILLISSLKFSQRYARSFRNILLVSCGTLCLLSLIFSVVLSGPQSPESYFATHVRLWELALGGLLAISGASCKLRWKDLATLLGLTLILVSVVAIAGEINFPGYVALVPTIGAALILAPGEGRSKFVAAILSNKAFVFVGGISYSLYLVHWPLIVFFLPEERHFSIGQGLLILVGSILISWCIKRWVEDKFRARGNVSLRSLKPILVASLTCVVPMAVYHFGLLSSQTSDFDPRVHKGAAVLIDGKTESLLDLSGFYPPIKRVKRDRAELYDNGCHLRFEDISPKECRFGRADGTTKVFLIGDSHAANWYPALEIVAKQEGWDGYVFTKSSCPLAQVPLVRSGAAYSECFDWGQIVLKRIAEEKPDMVIFGQMASAKIHTPSGENASMVSALTQLWEIVGISAGHIVVMAETPSWPRDPNECVSKGIKCSGSREQLIPTDPLVEAAHLSANVSIVDMNDYLCPDGVCQAIIGNVLVWRDRHHLTATYSKSMSPFLSERLTKVIASEQSN